MLELQCKIMMNSFNVMGHGSGETQGSKYITLMNARIAHRYLNTVWARAGNYPKDVLASLLQQDKQAITQDINTGWLNTDDWLKHLGST